MRTTPRLVDHLAPAPLAHRLAIGLALCLAGAAGCTKEEVVYLECDQACAVGFRCDTTVGVCVVDASVDGSAAVDMRMQGTCTPACAAPTAFCNLKNKCVPCLADGDCPAGNICKDLGNGDTVCTAGCKEDARCGGGSKKCCGGQCVDSAVDVKHCGACDMACSAQNQTPTCVAGACKPGTCRSGFGDCNKDAADGCESALRVDPDNCSACGMKCEFPNGISGCANECYLQACQYGWDDCNGDPMDGCEQTVTEDAGNCGGCGIKCGAVPKGVAGCANATCYIQSCDLGYADCDNDAMNGCEVEIGSDSNNCGACGKVCGPNLVCKGGACTCPMCELAIKNAASLCEIQNGMPKCIFDKCNLGFDNCDGDVNNGCEVDINNDPKNCGGCGKACMQGLLCRNGVCTAAVRITMDGEAYGHHGACNGWNGCGSAMNCALWACEVKGFQSLVAFGRNGPCTQFRVCHLFNARGQVQYNWGNGCDVAGVSDIDCK